MIFLCIKFLKGWGVKFYKINTPDFFQSYTNPLLWDQYLEYKFLKKNLHFDKVVYFKMKNVTSKSKFFHSLRYHFPQKIFYFPPFSEKKNPKKSYITLGE